MSKAQGGTKKRKVKEVEGGTRKLEARVQGGGKAYWDQHRKEAPERERQRKKHREEMMAKRPKKMQKMVYEGEGKNRRRVFKDVD